MSTSYQFHGDCPNFKYVRNKSERKVNQGIRVRVIPNRATNLNIYRLYTPLFFIKKWLQHIQSVKMCLQHVSTLTIDI